MATNTICFSVGRSTSDMATYGLDDTCTIGISSGLMTFTTGQTNANIGRGDRVNFGSDTDVYLWKKFNDSKWYVKTELGTTPANVTPGTDLNYIKRAFWDDPVGRDFDLAISSVTNAAVEDTQVYDKIGAGSADLRAGDLDADLIIALYKDTIPEVNTTTVATYGWVTDATHSLLIYCPTGTDHNGDTDANSDQSHGGVVNGGYIMEVDSSAAKDVWSGAASSSKQTDNVTVRGLQIRHSDNWKYSDLVSDSGGRLPDVDYSFSIWENCIFYSPNDADQSRAPLFNMTGGSFTGAVTIRNCVFVSDVRTTDLNAPYSGIRINKAWADETPNDGKERCFIYNNTIWGDYANACLEIEEAATGSGAPDPDYFSQVFNNACIAKDGAGIAFLFTDGSSTANDSPGFEYNAGSDTSGGEDLVNHNKKEITSAECDFESTTEGSQDLRIGEDSDLIGWGLGTSEYLEVLGSFAAAKYPGGSAGAFVDYDLDDLIQSGTRPTTDACVGAFEYVAAGQTATLETVTLTGVVNGLVATTPSVLGTVALTATVNDLTATTPSVLGTVALTCVVNPLVATTPSVAETVALTATVNALVATTPSVLETVSLTATVNTVEGSTYSSLEGVTLTATVQDLVATTPSVLETVTLTVTVNGMSVPDLGTLETVTLSVLVGDVGVLTDEAFDKIIGYYSTVDKDTGTTASTDSDIGYSSPLVDSLTAEVR